MFKAPFSFEGRIRRKEHTLSFLICFIYFFLISNLVFIPDVGFSLILCAFIPCWLFMFAQTAKRCHDVGVSGWYQFIPFYPFILFFMKGDEMGNKYGPNPKTGKDGYIAMDENEFINEQAVTETSIVYTPYTYQSDLGELIIEQEFSQPNIGERAFMNGKVADPDRYKIGFMNYIHIENGRIKRISMF
jgi:uncharacterized membrane protein YhaH (DUF805 family)